MHRCGALFISEEENVYIRAFAHTHNARDLMVIFRVTDNRALLICAIDRKDRHARAVALTGP
jgi:hypothetical protein